MKKLIVAVVAFLSFTTLVNAQKYQTRTATVYFNPNKDPSHKDYAAQSTEGTAVLQADKGTVALLMPMKTFHFNNALLEEHFNDNYLHTDKYPTATYKGALTGFNASMLTKDGTYNISSTGQVTMHGVTKNFTAPVKLTVSGKTATFYCEFKIKAEDYNVDVPGVVKPKLAEYTPLTATIKFAL